MRAEEERKVAGGWCGRRGGEGGREVAVEVLERGACPPVEIEVSCGAFWWKDNNCIEMN